MRATEALELSNPANELDQDLKDVCTHYSYKRNKTEVLAARQRNRRIARSRSAMNNEGWLF